MPSVTLTSLVGGGGGFRPDTVSAIVEIASGVTGVLATITPPSGKKAAITFLAASANQTGISVEINSVTVVSTNALAASTGAGGPGQFTIGQGSSSIFPYLLAGAVDQSITITKDAGNTTNSIRYAYAYGD